jgi:hypothetical protein
MASGAQRRKQKKDQDLAARLATNEPTELERRLMARLELAMMISAARVLRTRADRQSVEHSVSNEDLARALRLLLKGDRAIQQIESKALRGQLGLHDLVEKELKAQMPLQPNSPIVAHASALAVSEASKLAVLLTARLYNS